MCPTHGPACSVRGGQGRRRKNERTGVPRPGTRGAVSNERRLAVFQTNEDKEGANTRLALGMKGILIRSEFEAMAFHGD